MDIDTSKFKVSKTTLIGLLGLAGALIIAYTALPPKAEAAVIALALIRAAIAYLQKDAE